MCRKNWFWFWCWLLAASAVLAGCRGTRFVPDGEHLLAANPTFSGNKSISGYTLSEATKTRANRMVISTRLYLNFYNQGLAMSRDTSAVRRALLHISPLQKIDHNVTHWLLTDIGEAPILLDTTALREDSARIYSTYFANGFFYPKIFYETNTIKKSNGNTKYLARVKFKIIEGNPFIIDSIIYDIPETEVKSAYLESLYRLSPPPTRDTIWQTHLRPGMRYNQSAIAAERARIGDVMKNKGFFTFSPERIHFTIDTARHQLVLHIDPSGEIAYRVKTVTVRLFGARDSTKMEQVSMAVLDKNTVSLYREHYKIDEWVFNDTLPFQFLVSARVIDKVNYNFISERIRLKPGDIWSQQQSRRTQAALQELGMFQYVVVTYRINEANRNLDMTIDLRFSPQYQFRAGAESFNTTEYYGSNVPVVGLNLSYRDRNVFRRSELLDLKLAGNLGYYRAAALNAENATSATLPQFFGELDAKANLNLPRFLLPFPARSSRLLSRYNASDYGPATTLSSNYRFERRQQFDRTSTGVNIAYRWNHYRFDPTRASAFTPLLMEYIDIPRIDTTFLQTLKSQSDVIRREYQSRFSTRASYALTHTRYMSTRAHPTGYWRASLGWGGNIPWLLDYLSGTDGSTHDNKFRGLYYGRFVKTTFETKGYFPLNSWSEVVIRGAIGAASSYDNINTIPPEVRFFSGGANSMRAWPSNTLGPGRVQPSQLDTTNTVSNLLVPGGEYQLELNAEVRFNVISYLEMALFTEMGNVWLNNRSGLPTLLQERGTLRPENLRLGWDAGVGFRFDFSFLVLRVDLAQQLYNPALEQPWVIQQGLGVSIDKGYIRPQLGIGYPF